MSEFDQDPWGWVKDRFLDQNQVGKDVYNTGGILGPVQAGASAAMPDGGASFQESSGVNLLGSGSTQGQTDPSNFSSQPTAQPFAWSDDHGGTVYISRPDNSLEIRTGGTLAWRDNNPGNLRGAHTEIGPNYSKHGRLAIFENPDAGRVAQDASAFGPKYQNLSIGGAIAKYAPPKENNTEKYISDVEKRTGLDRGTILNTLNSSQRADYLNALRIHEGFKPGTSSMAYYNPFGHWGN